MRPVIEFILKAMTEKSRMNSKETIALISVNHELENDGSFKRAEESPFKLKKIWENIANDMNESPGTNKFTGRSLR